MLVPPDGPELEASGPGGVDVTEVSGHERHEPTGLGCVLRVLVVEELLLRAEAQPLPLRRREAITEQFPGMPE